MKRWSSGITVGWLQHMSPGDHFELRHVECTDQPLWRYLVWRVFHGTVCRAVNCIGEHGGRRFTNRLIWPDVTCADLDYRGRVRLFHFENQTDIRKVGPPSQEQWVRRFADMDSRRRVPDGE